MQTKRNRRLTRWHSNNMKNIITRKWPSNMPVLSKKAIGKPSRKLRKLKRSPVRKQRRKYLWLKYTNKIEKYNKSDQGHLKLR